MITTSKERSCPGVSSRVVLVISDAKYFQDYTFDRGDEFVNDHPDACVKRYSARAAMTCSARSNLVLNSWDRCNTTVTYWRIASSQALRGIFGPVEVVWQEDYRPRKMDELLELLRIINEVES